MNVNMNGKWSRGRMQFDTFDTWKFFCPFGQAKLTNQIILINCFSAANQIVVQFL